MVRSDSVLESIQNLITRSGDFWNDSLRLLFSLIKINGNIPLMISLHPNPGPDSFLNKGINSCVVCVEFLALIVFS